MSSDVSTPCYRLGVIGLGRLWEARHRPALERLPDCFKVTSVFDQVPARSQREAARLGCAAARGLRELVNREDVDAILLSTPCWFGLHPILLTCEAGKPAYCAFPFASESEDRVAAVERAVEQSGVVVVPEFARRFHPATLRLRELLESHLGAPRLILCQTRVLGFDRYGSPGPSTQMAPAPLLVDPGTYLLDWCRFIFGKELIRTEGLSATILPSHGSVEPDFEEVAAEFEGGAIARLTIHRFHREAWGDPSKQPSAAGIQVFAERGTARIDPPDRIQWTNEEGLHEEQLPVDPTIGEQLLRQFHGTLGGTASLAPTWDDAVEVAKVVRDLRNRSHV